MTKQVLSKDNLISFLDLIADGATVAAASEAIGCNVGSKSAYGWLAASESAAGELGEILPSEDSPFCIEWGGHDLEFFHICYRQAVEFGKAARAGRPSPLRAELEQRLAAKRSEPPRAPMLPPRVQVFRPDDEPGVVSHERHLGPVSRTNDSPGQRLVIDHVTQAPIAPPTPAPKARPAYAYKAQPLDKSGYTEPPPSEGRFSVSRHVVRDAERRAGTVELTDSGVVRH